jgi:hypothetical protein
VAGTDWASETADTIDKIVVAVRSKTTAPVEQVARYLVYGVVAAFLLATALVSFIILSVKLADDWIPGEVWSAYLVLGGIFIIAGLLVWTRRNRKTIRV